MSAPEHEHVYGEARRVRVTPIDVIAVTFQRGQGCCERSIYREVTAYYALDGTLLWENDPAPPATSPSTEPPEE